MGGTFSHSRSLLCQTNRYATTCRICVPRAPRYAGIFISYDIRTLPFPSCTFYRALCHPTRFRYSSWSPNYTSVCFCCALYAFAFRTPDTTDGRHFKVQLRELTLCTLYLIHANAAVSEKLRYSWKSNSWKVVDKFVDLISSFIFAK